MNDKHLEAWKAAMQKPDVWPLMLRLLVHVLRFGDGMDETKVRGRIDPADWKAARDKYLPCCRCAINMQPFREGRAGAKRFGVACDHASGRKCSKSAEARAAQAWLRTHLGPPVRRKNGAALLGRMAL